MPRSNGSALMDSSAVPVDRPLRGLLLGVVAVIALPHVAHLPLWVTGVCALLLVWQALTLYAGWGAPPRWLKALLALALFVAVFIGFGRVNGQTAGVSLLVLMLALKLSEIARLRDVVVVLALSCFMIATQFLFSQSLFMALYLLGGAWLIIAAYVFAHMGDGTREPRAAAGESLRLLLLAVPIAGLLFILFPRIPGPLWGLPADSGATATMGLSDKMTPGSVAALARSDGVALRARFPGAVPSPAQRYWRGPVFWDFDNGTWTDNTPQPAATRASVTQGQPKTGLITTDITLSPSREHWLVALDRPLSADRDYTVSAGGTLIAPNRIDDRIRYVTRSLATVSSGTALTQALRARALALPGTADPRARALAQHWVKQGLLPPAIVARALQMFRTQDFHYTLAPGAVDAQENVDAFLFRTRTGFCEHYAGAFTFLMRAAGIPARVVTGYLGATRSSIGNYWLVQNADAHAWSEVWLAGRGWTRVDPTAAVAPSRVDDGIQAALADSSDLPFMARAHNGNPWFDARMAWDGLNAGWNQWFLAYGPDLQAQLLGFFGLAGMGMAIAVLTASVTLLLALASLWMAWQMRRPRERDAVRRAWQRISQRLAASGLARRSEEGPDAYAQRVSRLRTDLAGEIHALARLYIGLRYAPDTHPQARAEFLARARRFRVARRN